MAGPASTSLEHVDLEIDGMTCAACAARIEKRLNKLEGVTASVNYATERASVEFPSGIDPTVLVAQVEAAGYGAQLPVAPGLVDEIGDERDHLEALGRLRTRAIVSAVLGIPVIAMAMVPALQFDRWQWVSLALTTADRGVVRLAVPSGRGAGASLHRSATMDTLVSIGTLAAYGWSVYALVFGTAGEVGMTMDMGLGMSHMSTESATGEIYLEAVAAVTLFVLAGRYAEARAKRRSGAALRALIDLGAKDVVVVSDSREVAVPIAELAVDDRFVVRPGERIATDGVVESTASSAVDASMVTGESVPVDDRGRVPTSRAATVNVGGRLVVRATRIGADTRVGVDGTSRRGGPERARREVQRVWPIRVSAVFVPVVIVAGASRRWACGWRCHGTTSARGLHRMRWPCSSSRARARSVSRRRRHSSSGRVAAHRWASADQGSREALEVDTPPGRHRGARQDRHGHDGEMAVTSFRSFDSGEDHRAWQPARRRGACLGASGRASDRPALRKRLALRFRR